MKWIPATEVRRLVFGLTAMLVVSAFLRSAGFYAFMARETEGLNVLLVLVGSIYSVLLAFTIFVIWGQFNDVENCVMRECNTLGSLLRFTASLDPDVRERVRNALSAYATRVLKAEWDALGDSQKDKHAAALFDQLMDVAIEGASAGTVEPAIRARILAIVQQAGEHREERIAKSLTRMPPTLVSLVNLIAGVLLLLAFVYPFHHWLSGMFCFVLVTAVLFLANFVMMDTDNPIKGVWNVSPQAFTGLK